MIPNYILNLNKLIFLLSLLLPSSTSTDQNNDRFALLNIRFIVRGRTLRWDQRSQTPCKWEGVGCDSQTGRVISLRLPANGLTGNLSSTLIGNLTELRAISLRGNNLFGPIPDGISSCKNLRDLHLQGNKFSGEIPRWFFALKNLRRVNLGFNDLTGTLSPEFNNLTELRVLYLESNRFVGPLPDLNGLTGLRRFNVSFNGLVNGSIPPSLDGFPLGSFDGTSLCGGNLSPCPSNDNNSSSNRKLSNGAIAGIAALGAIVALILIVVALLIIYRRRRRSRIVSAPRNNPYSKTYQQPIITATEEDRGRKLRTTSNNSHRIHAKERLEQDGLIFFGGNSSKAFTLQELLMSSAQIIHRGATGTTYRAYLELPLVGYFYGRDEHLIIYQSLPQGISLFELLHGKNGRKQLSWEIRARIALGIARAVDYLHSIGPEIKHGNINSSNVLIADYHSYKPYLSDHGLTQLVSSTANLNNGYRAPEVSDTGGVSQQSDVYSFGVLLSEIITGKEPERLMAEEGVELPRWVVRSIDGGKRASGVIDGELLLGQSGEFAAAEKLLNVAISCTCESPEDRGSMADVVRRIRESF